jgi:DNA polymerase III subunit epsilon
MYAIVDIETTGGYAGANGITEVAIRIHDGNSIIHRYETLINPGIPIPIYIRALTGISNEMVEKAPVFKEVASEIYSLLQDKIFVAHNVNFDYSFLRHHLTMAGFDLQAKKLCTVRLGRKIFPGLPSYSLGKFCRHLNVTIENRHRAGGDAEATALLFSLMLQNDINGHIKDSLNRNSKEQVLPPNLPKSYIDALPSCPGVYYFKDEKGKPIYVGKAKDLRKRVFSHFSGNNAGRQRQEFLRNIYSIAFEPCGTELMAFILEAAEIRRLWPANNRALKRFEQAYGLYHFEDQQGFIRLAIDKKRRYSSPLHSFNNLLEGHSLLLNLIKEFKLCPKLCFIQTNNEPCSGDCSGACKGKLDTFVYNERVLQSINYLKTSLPSFGFVDQGRSENEYSFILMEKGNFYGMGYVDTDQPLNDLELVKSQLQQYPCNDYIRNLVLNYTSNHPERIISFST